MTERFTDSRYFAKHPWMEYVFIATACLSQIIVQAGSMETMSILNVLKEYYNTSTTHSAWYISSFALSLGTLILISGRIGDVYGAREVVVGGYIWTIIWSAIAGGSYYIRKAPEFFIICRAFQGAGLAMVFPNIIGAVGKVYTHGTLRKHLMFAILGWCAPVGGVNGPFWTGLIAVKTDAWNWMCWAFLIGSFIALCMTLVSFPKIPHSGRNVDWVGCLLALGGLLLVNFCFNQAPIVGWKNPYIITLLIVGFILLGIFCWYEQHIPSNPLVPSAVLAKFPILVGLLCLFFSWGSFGILSYRLYTFLLNVRNYTALAAGAATMPANITGFFAAMSTPFLIKRIGIPVLFVISMVAFLGANLLVLTLPVHQVYWRNTFAIFFIGAMAMDWSWTAGTIMLSDHLPHHVQGMAGSLVMTMVSYGISFFVGMDATVEQQITLHDPENMLKIHRGSEALGVGLAGISIIVAIIFVLVEYFDSKKVLTQNEVKGRAESHHEQYYHEGAEVW